MRKMFSLSLPVVTLAACAGAALGQTRSAVQAVTTESGMFIVPAAPNAARHPAPAPAGIDALLWQFVEPVAIPNSCGLSQSSGHAWVGQQLNNERLQLFLTAGDGVPLNEFPMSLNNSNPVVAAAAMNADLGVVLDQIETNGPFVARAYRSNSTSPIWTYDVPTNFTGTGFHNLKVSRDGSTVCFVVIEAGTNAPSLITLNASDGSLRSQWTGTSGGSSGLEITDDGSKAIFCEGSPPAGIGRLIDTSNGTEITTFPANGAGGWFNISGDGSVVVIGGFNLRVFVDSGSGYELRINFSASGSWFSWGSAVSRDGSTVAAISHLYTTGNNTDVRIWDVATAQLLGTVSTGGTGSFQDSAVGGVLSDDGSRFAVASWGTQDNSHPEVRVFDRDLNLIDSLDTPGSPFCIDMTGDGRYVLVGYKSVHANTFGNGGGVAVLELPGGTTCYPNCDGSTTAPILNVNDFVCFQQAFAAGDTYANCDGSTTPPVLNVNDFVCFQQQFAAGCP